MAKPLKKLLLIWKLDGDQTDQIKKGMFMKIPSLEKANKKF